MEAQAETLALQKGRQRVEVRGRRHPPIGPWERLSPRQQALRLDAHEDLAGVIDFLLTHRLSNHDIRFLWHWANLLTSSERRCSIEPSDWQAIGRLSDRILGERHAPTLFDLDREELLDQIDLMRTQTRVSEWERSFLDSLFRQVMSGKAFISIRQHEILDAMAQKKLRSRPDGFWKPDEG